MAKIERKEAIAELDDILKASDAIMVARGDLSVEVGDAAVPALQKRMIRTARTNNKTSSNCYPDDGINGCQSGPH